MSASQAGVQDGFERHFRQSRFTDPWEPLYSKVEDDQVRIGVVLAEAHCNSRGLVHGAFLAAIADNAIGLSCGAALTAKGSKGKGIVTSNLSIDYVGRAEVGEWIATDTDVIKAGRTLCVASCMVSTPDRIVARVNATFQVV